MIQHDTPSDSLLLLFHYWELSAHQVLSELDALTRKGVHQITSFVPWQVAESDIRHTLERFLQSAADRGIQVSLILSPELGLPFSESGLPKDLIRKKTNRALTSDQKPIGVGLPPRLFPLPSFFSPEILQRYYGFLAKMNRFFCALEKHSSPLLEKVTLCLTGGLWQYYGCHSENSVGGDFSPAAMSSFRKQLELFFAGEEFCFPVPAAANRWKTQAMDEVNSQWFFQQAEEAFRQRSLRILSQHLHCPVHEIHFFTPFADPQFFHSQLLQLALGDRLPLTQISEKMEQRAAQVCSPSSRFSNKNNTCYFYWPSFGGFQALSEGEKQFFILKSFLVNGGRGGGAALDYRDWFQLSESFRNRYHSLSHSLAQKNYHAPIRAYYLVPHLWSSFGKRSGGLFLRPLSESLGSELKMTASLDCVLGEKSTQLLWIDADFIFTQERLRKVLAWVKGGKRVLVLPQTAYYSPFAKREWEEFQRSHPSVPVDFGFAYDFFSLGEGQCVSFSFPLDNNPSLQAQAIFIQTILSLANLNAYYSIEASEDAQKTTFIPFVSSDQKGSFLFFILNHHARLVSFHLQFAQTVWIEDGVRLGGLGAEAILSSEMNSQQAWSRMHASSEFVFDVPAYGVLPIRVHPSVTTSAFKKELYGNPTRLASVSKVL